MSYKHKPTKISNPQGGALVEFLISFPLLLLLFSGVFELGRLYSQLTWVSNIGYEVALAGAVNPQGPLGASDMTARSSLLAGITAYNKLSNAPVMIHTYNTSMTNSVSVEVDGHISPIFQWITGDLKTKITAPMLSSNNSNSGPLNQFLNPSCLYSCSGIPISPCCNNPGCAPASC